MQQLGAIGEAMPAKISIQNVHYTYADGNEALRNISFDVQPNEVFVLFGPSTQRQDDVATSLEPAI